LSGRFTEEEKSVLEAGAERCRQSRESGFVRAILAASIMPTKRANTKIQGCRHPDV
jgi:hypothetical protein